MIPDDRIVVAPEGLRGFDINTTVTRDMAEAFLRDGYAFVVRYVPRTTVHPFDLTAVELDTILDTGLGLMVVQHVATENWTPTAALGAQYGKTAVDAARRAGVLEGTTLWCDLEGVIPGTPAAEIIAYCNAWYEAVHARFTAGLYVGWHAGLTPEQLYHDLRFTRYWSAYNLDADAVPAVRGVQMQQHPSTPSTTPPGIDRSLFDVNVITTDKLGDRPILMIAPSHFLGEV